MFVFSIIIDSASDTDLETFLAISVSVILGTYSLIFSPTSLTGFVTVEIESPIL